MLTHHGGVGRACGRDAGQQRAVELAHLVVDALYLGLPLVSLLGVEVGEQVTCETGKPLNTQCINAFFTIL